MSHAPMAQGRWLGATAATGRTRTARALATPPGRDASAVKLVCRQPVLRGTAPAAGTLLLRHVSRHIKHVLGGAQDKACNAFVIILCHFRPSCGAGRR